MNRLPLVIFFLVISFSVFAQNTGVEVKHSGQSLYLDHKVAPKEGLFAIGRVYNIHPKTIAEFNNIDMFAGLAIGQQIRIPLTDTNFSQQSTQGVALFHQTKSGDNLSKISDGYRNVSVQKLKDWNNLSSDQLAAGQPIIVGFLKTNNPTAVKSVPINTGTPVQNTTPVVTKTEPAPAPVQNTTQQTTQPAQPVVKAEPKNTQVVEVQGQGYFKPHFDQQVRVSPVSANKEVTAGIFKTTSGWKDGKYYLLIDGLPVGSIVSISNPNSSKTVYAKVLGEMNGIRMNRGYDVRISNATAAALNISADDKFTVKLSY